ncbi:MAG: outer membrane beta-barrel protein [Candidatus Aminicenantes bacterium]|nr:outer membrane beta-barrel protein [Candidatus Aminicenantes bacterium]
MTQKGWWTKKRMLLIFALFFASCSFFNYAAPIESFAGKATAKSGRHTGVGLWGGYGLYGNSQFNGGVAFGASFLLGLGRNLAIEFAASYLGAGVESDANALSKGKLAAMPLQLSLQGRFPVGKKLTPYLLVGGNYFLNSFSLDSTIVDGWSAVGITLSEKVAGAFGFHAGAGLELALGNSLSLNIDLRYFLAKTKSNWSMTDDESLVESSGTLSGIKLDALVFALGLKYFFK